jgi:hypothetical protein
MRKPKQLTSDEAKRNGDSISIDWSHVDLEQFHMGLFMELEHGTKDSETNMTNDDMVLTGKIALAHLKEFPDYYARLATLEAEADIHWAKKREQAQ